MSVPFVASCTFEVGIFCRTSKRTSRMLAPRMPLWTGLVSKKDNMLYGHNMQGELQMRVRERLFQDA